MKQAIWNNTVIAEANEEDTIMIEGNVYFPPNSLKKEFFKPSDMHSTCPWKGEASYYDVVLPGVDNKEDEENKGAAWYYPSPKEGSIPIVGKDFSDYVGFWRGVEVR